MLLSGVFFLRKSEISIYSKSQVLKLLSITQYVAQKIYKTVHFICKSSINFLEV